MMGLAKMAPDGWAYYAREIAAGVEDYFVGHGEEKGRWIGRGAEALGSSGEADAEGLSRLFGRGLHPGTGAELGRPFNPDSNTVAGYALSFSPPKSVSILWALADDESVSAAVRAGHDQAVEGAWEFLQDHAAFCRRGRGGLTQEATGGYVAAVFVHRTSRAGDPQLHSHVLVANKVQAVSDGRWLAIDGRELYEVQKAAGMLYKACLRAGLSARLGIAWTEVHENGGAEIVGVPDGLIRLFSKRRAQVKSEAAGLIAERQAVLGRSLTGDERAAVFQVAAYRSRAAKDERGETTEQLRARWRAEATGAGHPPPSWRVRLAGRRVMSANDKRMAWLGIQPSLELYLNETIEVLERKHSTWGRAQVVEALSVVLPTAKASSAERHHQMVEAAADRILAHPDVVRLTCADRPHTRHGNLRYSTWWTLQTEQAILDVVESGRGARVAVVPTHRVLAEACLAPDQDEAVRRLCAGGERVAVMVGPAGSGKSRTLRAAGQAWQAAGIAVRGVAPSAVAAGVLHEQAGIQSETLAKFLLDSSKGRVSLKQGEVVVCDETSMVSTRDLARLVLLVESAGGKLVLVGDHYQLGSVEAGGLFRLLASDAKTAELTGVRRFADPWEAQATRRLRRGDKTVIAEFIDRGRVQAGERDQALDAAHQAWLDARQAGRSVVVMAADHDTVDQLANRARATRVAAGEVQTGAIAIGNQTVGVGDEIVTTRNDRRLVTTTGAWVRNGDRWQVTRRSPPRRPPPLIPRRPRHRDPPRRLRPRTRRPRLRRHHPQRAGRDHRRGRCRRGPGHQRRAPLRGHDPRETPQPSLRHHRTRRRRTPTPRTCQRGRGSRGTLQRTSNELSATEILRNELDLPGAGTSSRDALREGLRQHQAHSDIVSQTIRREARRQAFTQPQTPSPEPRLYQGIEL